MKGPSEWKVLSECPDFGKLFTGDSISILGTNVTNLAVPLAAAILLQASPFEMGLLGAVAFIPHLAFGLPAGVWVGRLPYKYTIVTADVLRALLLISVPLLAASGSLTLWQLYAVVFLCGTCTLFDNVAATSFVPQLVGRTRLLQANSMVSQSAAVMNSVGSALGGVLIQLMTAPIAILVDSISFALAALVKLRIRNPGRSSASSIGRREGLWREIRAGIRAVFQHEILRPLMVSAAVGALFGQMQNVILILFLLREIRLTPAAIGLVVAAGSAGSILGAMGAYSITNRVGSGRAYILGGLLVALGGFGLSVVGGGLSIVIVWIIFLQIIRGVGPSLFSVNQSTIRQALADPGMLSRVNATWRFVVFGVQPIGATLGGLLGEIVGLRSTFALSSGCMMLGILIAWLSPLRRLRTLAT